MHAGHTFSAVHAVAYIHWWANRQGKELDPPVPPATRRPLPRERESERGRGSCNGGGVRCGGGGGGRGDGVGEGRHGVASALGRTPQSRVSGFAGCLFFDAHFFNAPHCWRRGQYVASGDVPPPPSLASTVVIHWLFACSPAEAGFADYEEVAIMRLPPLQGAPAEGLDVPAAMWLRRLAPKAILILASPRKVRGVCAAQPR